MEQWEAWSISQGTAVKHSIDRVPKAMVFQMPSQNRAFLISFFQRKDLIHLLTYLFPWTLFICPQLKMHFTAPFPSVHWKQKFKIYVTEKKSLHVGYFSNSVVAEALVVNTWVLLRRASSRVQSSFRISAYLLQCPLAPPPSVRLEISNHFYKQSDNHKIFNKLNIWYNKYIIQRESIDIIIFITYSIFFFIIQFDSNSLFSFKKNKASIIINLYPCFPFYYILFFL